MSLIVQNSRTLLKRSQISGATPTVKTGSTQHTDGTWVDTEIYPGEIYWNMEDRIMYIGWEDISGNTGTDVLVTGAGTGSCVTDFYVENIFGCPFTNASNLINFNSLGMSLQTTVSGNTAYILLEDTNTIGQPQIQLTSTDGVNTSNILLNETTMTIASNFIELPTIQAFADDADAATGGLTTGMIYETDGTGAAPLNVAGILMRKQ
jgi:hypothetical protein